MKGNKKPKSIFSMLVILLIVVMSSTVLLVGCSTKTKEDVVKEDNAVGSNTNTDQQEAAVAFDNSKEADAVKEDNTIVYENTQYGFKLSLPDSWNGYTIVPDEWEGISLEDTNAQSDNIAESGPLLYIRHPQWTKQNERQDIPIMVFTLDQWDLLQNEKFHIGAAPIGPSELARNSKYVFALPARYNFAFLTGYEEVDEIINSNALKATEDYEN